MNRDQLGKYLKRGYWSSFSDNVFIKYYVISLNYLFDRIRYYAPVKIRFRLIQTNDYDCNADYMCMHCSYPVLRNYLYCSIACVDLDDIYHHSNKKLCIEDD